MIEQLLAHLWGDYILQSHWMATKKREDLRACFVHATFYTICFLPITLHLAALVFIFITHFFIDGFGLARYVVWIKNHIAPPEKRFIFLGEHRTFEGESRFYPWEYCKETGFASGTPQWLAVWLLIIVDNTLHMTCNYLALRFL